MSTGYTEADFARAVEIVGTAKSLSTVVEALGIEWEYLVWLALGVAEEMLGHATEALPDGLANGAEAFAAGLLIGVHLPERREQPADLGLRFSWALDEVRERGRSAIIAEHCNAATVAVLDQVYGSALAESLRLPERRVVGVRSAFTRLLETGLATGLVLTRDGSSA